MNCRLALSLVAILASVALGVLNSHGQEIRLGSRDELIQALAAARPGTTIRLAPGTYRGGLAAAALRGTAAQPIVIGAADPAQPPVIEGGGGGLHLASPEHVELRDLVFAGAGGNGLNIDDGGQIDTPARHIVLRNLVVRDVGPMGNRDGIKLSGVRDFLVAGCRVERWGSSGSAIDMVGCQQGVIEGCTFANATGEGANGVQAKGGSSQITIRQCRFENAGGRGVNAGGSTGLPYFRPRDAAYEAQAITVEDCDFLGGSSAVAFVGVDGAIVQHNTIYRPKRWPFRILQENTDPRFVACRGGKVLANLVVFRSDEVRETVNIGPQTAPDSFTFAGNAWYCLDRPADTERLVRLPVAQTNATYGQDPGLADPERGDLTIRKPLPGAAGRRQP